MTLSEYSVCKFIDPRLVEMSLGPRTGRFDLTQVHIFRHHPTHDSTDNNHRKNNPTSHMLNLIPWLCCKTQGMCVWGGGGGHRTTDTSHAIIQPHILPPHHTACILQPRQMRHRPAAVTILEGGRSHNARSPLDSLSPCFCAVAQKRLSPPRFPERFNRALSGPIVHHLEDGFLV